MPGEHTPGNTGHVPHALVLSHAPDMQNAAYG